MNECFIWQEKQLGKCGHLNEYEHTAATASTVHMHTHSHTHSQYLRVLF
jgi:hypothetical protein